MTACEACWTAAEKEQRTFDLDDQGKVAVYVVRLQKCEHTARERHGGWLDEAKP